jgi:hypothetical protein
MIKDNIPDGLLSCCDPFFLPGRLLVDKLSMEDARLLDRGERTKKDFTGPGDTCDPVHKANIISLLEAVWAYSAREASVPK